MQGELDAESPLPWLQPVEGQDVWTDWAVAYRDVVILTPDNEVFAVYNLTLHSLADPANRQELADLLRAAGR
jgi:hypothetical protein